MTRSRQNDEEIRTLVALFLDLKALRWVRLVVLPRDLASFRLLVHIVALVVELILV